MLLHIVLGDADVMHKDRHEAQADCIPLLPTHEHCRGYVHDGPRNCADA